MTMLRRLSLWLFLSCPGIAWACEPPSVLYEPMVITNGAGSAKITTFVSQNAPVVRDLHLGRGTAAQSSLCGGQGYISFTVDPPNDAAVSFANVGLEILVVEGDFPQSALPQGPFRSTLEPNEGFQHLGSWFEGPPSTHETINAVINVSFIAPDGTVGPATAVTLFSEAIEPDGEEGHSR